MPGGRKQQGIIFHPVLGYAIPPPVPLAVQRRNARERTRVKTVNQSYESLKAHVPSAARHKRMSKVEIIKHAMDYIERLQRMVEQAEEECALSSSNCQSSISGQQKMKVSSTRLVTNPSLLHRRQQSMLVPPHPHHQQSGQLCGPAQKPLLDRDANTKLVETLLDDELLEAIAEWQHS